MTNAKQIDTIPGMTVAEIKSKLKRKIDKLSGKKLKEADAYIDQLVAPQEPAGTKYKPEFIARVKKAMKDAKAGKTISLEELKRRNGFL